MTLQTGARLGVYEIRGSLGAGGMGEVYRGWDARLGREVAVKVLPESSREKGIFLIPDFLANAGGVTCSYFEQVQSNMNMYWVKDEVLGRLDATMTAAFHAVADVAKRRRLPMRDAAYVISISRVAQACHERGWV